MQIPDQPAVRNKDRERFGDRIARLIGKVGPDEARPPVQPASPQADPEPAASTQQAPSQSEYGARDFFARQPAPHQDDQIRDDHYHWHAASQDASDNGQRPLLDASILISAVWRYRALIAAFTILGAVLGVLMALSTPHKYYAESRLFVDPREIRVTQDDSRNQQLSTEAMLAITDSQLQILSSTSVLEKVIIDLGLERDPEFNGSLSSGGIGGGVALIKEIFTGKGGPSDAEQKALEKLRDSLSVSRDAKTFVIIIGVTTRDAEKSALITNQIVETYLDSEGQAQSNLLERTSESIDTRINALRSDLDKAEREVESFKAENGLVGVGGQFIDDKVILALSDQLANARAQKIGIKVKADNLAGVRIGDVLSGAFPEELLSSNLTALRKQYTDTKSRADSLATSLGPRHPQYIAAQSSLDAISTEISAELRRIVASSQTELQRAVETEQELANQMAVAKSRAMDQSVEFVTLRELERKAAATRGIYEAFLTRSRETSEGSNFTSRNVRVISPAEAPLDPMGPSRKLLAVAGMVAGFFAGVGVALLAGAVESIRSYNAGTPQARFQAPPFSGYSGAPDPDPRTPPQGPSRRERSRRDEGLDASFDRAAEQSTSAAFSGARAQTPDRNAYSASAEQDGNYDRATPARLHNPAATAPAMRSAPADTGPDGPQRHEAAHAAPLPSQAYPTDQSAQPGQAPGMGDPAMYYPHPHARNPAQPQDFRSANAEQSWQMQAPFAQPHPSDTRYQAHQDPRLSDPRMGQPHWPGYPAHAQHSAPYSHQPALMTDPYAPNAGGNAGYSAQNPGHPMQPPVMPQHIAPQPYQQPQPTAYGQNGQPYYPPSQNNAQRFQPLMPAPQAPEWQHNAPTMPQYPDYQQPAQVPHQEAHYQPAPMHHVRQTAPAMPSPQPVRTDDVDRIRREMDMLKSRIDGYGSVRRHG